jgi:hypothetical protein
MYRSLTNDLQKLLNTALPEYSFQPAARGGGDTSPRLGRTAATTRSSERHFTHQLVTGSTLRTNWLSQNSANLA